MPQPKWRDIEYFHRAWKRRIREMSKYLRDGQSVMDLGCGKMWLKDYLRNNAYVPVDYTYRGPGTIVCDFNQKLFPDRGADVAFVSGALEYLEHGAWFISQLGARFRSCVVSYCPLEDYPDVKARSRRGWVNHYTVSELLRMFRDAGFELVDESRSVPRTAIFFFEKPT